MDAGLSSRFAAAGGNLFEAMLSKLVISFVMTFIPVACFIAILGLGKLSVLLPVLGVLFVFSFAFFLFVGCASGSAATAQLVGNIIMLLMLTLGGGLYPLQLMPDALQKIGAFTVPGALLGAMKQAYLSRGLAEILPGLVPHAIAAVAFFLLSLPFFGKRRRA